MPALVGRSLLSVCTSGRAQKKERIGGKAKGKSGEKGRIPSGGAIPNGGKLKRAKMEQYACLYEFRSSLEGTCEYSRGSKWKCGGEE